MNVRPISSAYPVPGKNGTSGSVLELNNVKLRIGSENSGFCLNVKNLLVETGKWVGIVGPVGSGKSTLFDLILRLHEPAVGSVFYRGNDVLGIRLADLRAQIASVEQQVFLFSDTVAGNIAMGSQKGIHREEIERVAKLACLDREIYLLSHGFETVLGERGVNLSGGQKQRLALSRALYRTPSLLLLDDSFSSVDVQVENSIIQNLRSNKVRMNLCLASHRLNMMPQMDEIWVLDRGSVVGIGTHSRLLKHSVLYQSLWDKSESQEQGLREERDERPRFSSEW